MGTYRTVHERSLEEPALFWAEAASSLHWDRPWDMVLDARQAAVLPLVRRRPAQHLLQCRRPPRRRRPRRPGRASSTTAPSPAPSARSPMPSCATSSRASPAPWPRHGVGKGDRVIIYMPMVPEAVVAMLACARIGAIHSVVFGGFAANELATRIDDAKPKRHRRRFLRHRGRTASSPTSRCSTGRSTRRTHKPPACIILQRPQGRAELDARPRPGLGRARCTAHAGRLRAGRGHRPALHPLHVGHHRPARRAWCATTAAMRWRCLDRCRTSTASSPARSSGPPPTSAGSSATATSSTARCCTAAPPSSTRASRSARPTPAPSGASSPSTRWARCSPRRPRSAPSRRRTRTAAASASYDLSRFRTLFLAGERGDPPTRRLGAKRSSACRSSITGGRPRPAGRSPPICLGIEQLAGQARLADGAVPGCDVQVLDERRRADAGAARWARLAIKLPLPPGALPTLWHADEHFAQAYLSRLPRLLPDRRRRLHRRGRLSLRHDAASTTSSMSPGIASRPAAWRRCWRRTPTSPSAP